MWQRCGRDTVGEHVIFSPKGIGAANMVRRPDLQVIDLA